MIDQAAIQGRRTVRDELAAATDLFLAAGGKIEEAPPLQVTPKPLSAGTLKGPSVRGRRIVKTAGDAKAEKRQAHIDKLRELAKTMTQAQAAEEVGCTRRTISHMGKVHNITFLPAGGPDRTNDAADVERIKAAKDLGVTRNQVMKALAISFERFNRLLRENDIEFPKQKREPR